VLTTPELFVGHQPEIVGIDEMIEDLRFGAFGDAHEMRELLVPVARESFGDVARR
jgi:hypothetical protein